MRLPTYQEFLAKYGERPPDIVFAITQKDTADLTRKEIDKKVKAYFETEPWMTLEDWRILKLGSKGE